MKISTNRQLKTDKKNIRRRKQQKENYEKNKEKVLVEVRAGYKKNKKKIIESAATRKNYYRKEARRLALEKYGGKPPKCACCGETEYVFLAIDHIKGGGNKHRIFLSKTTHLGLMGWLVETRKKPAQFQVLCHNCNMGKSILGICPHKKNS